MKRNPIVRTLGLLVVGVLTTTGCYEGANSGSGNGGKNGKLGPELPAPASRYFRLTHDQWERTVQDLFYLDAPTGLSETFRADPNSGGYFFDNDSSSLVVDQPLWNGYQTAAVAMADQVANDAAVLDAISPLDSGDTAARGRAFVEDFVYRAYRRPLTPEETEEHMAIFNSAASLYEGQDPYVAGVQLVVQAVLQSPHFLYRVEDSSEPDGDLIPLDDFELASRLSYFLWSSMPDQELFDLAEAGELTEPETLEAQVRRMIDDPRARAIVGHFHEQLLEVEQFADATPSPAFFPDVDPRIGEYAVEENRLFMDEMVYERDASWADVLTSSETFVNAELAKVYGVSGNFSQDEYELVQLDPTQRKGLFTQVGFLAANASAVDPDPIHRGVFMVRRVVCATLSPPPDNITPLPPLEPDQTNRERTTAHTEQPGSVCSGCHSALINPYGFSFEHYDAIGAWRDEDNGQPVDAASEVMLDGDTVPVADAVELADVLAASEDVQKCYASHWIQYANGRPPAEQDEVLATRLARATIKDGLPVKELLVELVMSPSFTNRALEEVQQ